MEQECGRVLGMEFNPLNPSELYAVDCSLGLLKINVETKEIKNLLPTTQNNEENTIFCNFVNDLTVLENGSVFFTDSSKKFKRSKNKLEFAESRPNGGLFQYNPHSNLISFVADGLYFPNGICVNHDRDSILFAESTRARIMRYVNFGFIIMWPIFGMCLVTLLETNFSKAIFRRPWPCSSLREISCVRLLAAVKVPDYKHPQNYQISLHTQACPKAALAIMQGN